MELIKYMDMSKFISLLEGGSLYFCRADLLEDESECLPFTTEDIYVTENFMRVIKKLSLGESTVIKSQDSMKKANENSKGDRLTKFICSWTKGGHENYALWKIYCANANGVAIKSSVEKILKCLAVPKDFESEFDHGDVTYGGATGNIDHTMRKMRAYRYEDEYRFLFDFDFDDPNIAAIMPASRGLKVSVKLNDLIDEVILSPFQAIMTEELMRNLLKRYGLETKKVSKSYLSSV